MFISGHLSTVVHWVQHTMYTDLPRWTGYYYLLEWRKPSRSILIAGSFSLMTCKCVKNKKCVRGGGGIWKLMTLVASGFIKSTLIITAWLYAGPLLMDCWCVLRCVRLGQQYQSNVPSKKRKKELPTLPLKCIWMNRVINFTKLILSAKSFPSLI